MRDRKDSWGRKPVKETEAQWLEEGKELSRLISLSPVFGLYILWLAAVFRAQGLIPAGIASLGLACIIWGRPKGVVKQAGAVFLFGVVLPAAVAVILS